jgi:CheY-like chemotaxis protein
MRVPQSQNGIEPASGVGLGFPAQPFSGMLADPNSSHAMQQRLFGLLNEAGTNVSHVPTTFANPGQSYTFQHARFAISGSDVSQVLSQSPETARGSLLATVFNHPGLHPIYKPSLYGANEGVNMDFQAATSSPRLFPPQNQGYFPNYTSVMAHNVPKTSQGQQRQPMTSAPVALSSQMMNSFSLFNPGMAPYVLMKLPQEESASTMNNEAGNSTRSSVQAKKLVRRNTDEDASSSKKRRKKRDPSLPTPARFAWNFYFRDQYTKIRNSEPSEHTNVQKAFTEIGFDLGKKWKSLSREEKEPYLKLAAQDKERYEKEMQIRFNNHGGSTVTAAGAVSSDDASEEDEEKVAIVLHEVEVEDNREEHEKQAPPTEGELVADVLIVDDDEVFLKIIRHKLVVGQKNPPRIVTVTSAADAKRMLVDENKKFGAVFLDKDFGDGKEDGISSLQVIRESGYEGVIIGVTGSSDDATKSQFSEKGANSTFVKGSSNFYDDLTALVKLHSSNVKKMEEEEEKALKS